MLSLKQVSTPTCLFLRWAFILLSGQVWRSVSLLIALWLILEQWDTDGSLVSLKHLPIFLFMYNSPKCCVSTKARFLKYHVVRHHATISGLLHYKQMTKNMWTAGSAGSQNLITTPVLWQRIEPANCSQTCDWCKQTCFTTNQQSIVTIAVYQCSPAVSAKA